MDLLSSFKSIMWFPLSCFLQLLTLDIYSCEYHNGILFCFINHITIITFLQHLVTVSVNSIKMTIKMPLFTEQYAAQWHNAVLTCPLSPCACELWHKNLLKKYFVKISKIHCTFHMIVIVKILVLIKFLTEAIFFSRHSICNNKCTALVYLKAVLVYTSISKC